MMNTICGDVTTNEAIADGRVVGLSSFVYECNDVATNVALSVGKQIGIAAEKCRNVGIDGIN